MVGGLEVNTSHTVHDVKKTVIVLYRFVVGCYCREGSALVLNQDRAEVLEVPLPYGTAVRGIAAPQRLLVELDVVRKHPTPYGGPYLTVTHRQGIFHPRIADTRGSGGSVVPEREIMYVRWAGALLSHTELRRQHIRFGNKVEGVVTVSCLPQSNLLAYARSTPLVKEAVGLGGCSYPRNLVHSRVAGVGSLLNGKALSIFTGACLHTTSVVVRPAARAFVHKLEFRFVANKFPQLGIFAIQARLRCNILGSPHILNHQIGITKCDVVIVVLHPFSAEKLVRHTLNSKHEAGTRIAAASRAIPICQEVATFVPVFVGRAMILNPEPRTVLSHIELRDIRGIAFRHHLGASLRLRARHAQHIVGTLGLVIEGIPVRIIADVGPQTIVTCIFRSVRQGQVSPVHITGSRTQEATVSHFNSIPLSVAQVCRPNQASEHSKKECKNDFSVFHAY